jgi:hypothetical protein
MSTPDLWYVKTRDGDLHRMTLDEIDEAFNAGRIDENVMVMPSDGSGWSRLGQLAGLDAPVPPSPMFAGVPSSLRPVSFHANEEIDPQFTPKKRRSPIVFAAVVGVVAVVGAAFVVKNSGMLRHSSSSASDTMSIATATATAAAAAAAPAPSPSPSPSPVAAPPPAPVAATAAPTTNDSATASSKSKGAKKKKGAGGHGKGK